MHIIPIKTRALVPPQDSLLEALEDIPPTLKERDVLVISSKVVAIHQGRCVRIEDVSSKDALIRSEADHYLPIQSPYSRCITAKGNLLVGTSGIDESNANGHYILWPEHPFDAAKELWSYYRARFSIETLGVVIVDSVSVPFRYGAMGASIGFWGIAPINDYRGRKDIFGREILYERGNIVDGIAAAAVVAMGETNEQTPACVVRDASMVEFTDEDRRVDLLIDDVREDKFYPLLKPLLESDDSENTKC